MYTKLQEILESLQKHKDDFVTIITEKDTEKFDEIMKNISDDTIKDIFVSVHNFYNSLEEFYEIQKKSAEKENKKTESDVEKAKTILKDKVQKLKEAGKTVVAKIDLDEAIDSLKNFKNKVLKDVTLRKEDVTEEDYKDNDDFTHADFIKITFCPFCADTEEEKEEVASDDCQCQHCNCEAENTYTGFEKCQCNKEVHNDKNIASSLLDEINSLPVPEDEVIASITKSIYTAVTDKVNKPYILHRQTRVSAPAVEVRLSKVEYKAEYFLNSSITGPVKENLMKRCGFKDVLFSASSDDEHISVYMIV